MSRNDFILAMFDPSGFGLEIGPSYNPLLPKSGGYNVETLDYASQADLIAKYSRNNTVEVSRIEPVDFVSDGRPMAEVIGARDRYDFIVASHVIEHTPDMIGFLQDCETLLKEDGVLVLAVPDKRCCFDVYQRLTSTGEVLEAHRRGMTRPGYGSIFDAVAYGVTQGGQTGWSKNAPGPRKLFQTLEDAKAIADQSANSGNYTDVHVWRFVPSSFELIVNDLFEIGQTGLRIASSCATDEFLVVLSRQGPAPSRSRLDMLEAAALEQAHQHSLPRPTMRRSHRPKQRKQ